MTDLHGGLPDPEQRVECLTCHRWPMAKNWPNHMQGANGPHWPAALTRTADPGGLRAAVEFVLGYIDWADHGMPLHHRDALLRALTPEATAPEPCRRKRGDWCGVHDSPMPRHAERCMASPEATAPGREAIVIEMENEGVVTWGDDGHRARFIEQR